MIYAERQPNRESGNIKDAGAVTARHMPDMTCGPRIKISPHTVDFWLKAKKIKSGSLAIAGGWCNRMHFKFWHCSGESSSKYYLKKEGVLCTLLTRHKTIFKEHFPYLQGFVADCLNGGRRPPAEPHFILMLNPHNSGVSTAAQDISFEKLSSFTNSSTYI